MKKIISLFRRNYDGDRLVRNEVTPGAEWVLEGEGVPTIKWDGTCCMVKAGVLYKRYDAKHGKQPPDGFIPAQDPDDKTGHWPGWIAVGHGPEDKWHLEAFKLQFPLDDGTYELIGPKINGGNEFPAVHVLMRHGQHRDLRVPHDFEGLRQYFAENVLEGIVWHHSDGRMVKIKRKDFGFPWPDRDDHKTPDQEIIPQDPDPRKAGWEAAGKPRVDQLFGIALARWAENLLVHPEGEKSMKWVIEWENSDRKFKFKHETTNPYETLGFISGIISVGGKLTYLESFPNEEKSEKPHDHKTPSAAQYALNNIEKFREAMDEMPEGKG